MIWWRGYKPPKNNAKPLEFDIPKDEIIGLIAGNGEMPFDFCAGAKKSGCKVVAVGHIGETDPKLEQLASSFQWIKVGELGKLIKFFKDQGVKRVAMAGGISRVKLFGGGVKLDVRGALTIAKLRSVKDDVIMRGIASELESEGMEVISSVTFLQDSMASPGVMTKARPAAEELKDIEVGLEAIDLMSELHIGQVVVVKEGVIVAVEAVEGTDRTITRGGELGGKGVVVVKFSKRTQDMRFDVPTIGVKTVESMIAVGGRVLAIESGKCLMLNKQSIIELADKHGIVIVGCERKN